MTNKMNLNALSVQEMTVAEMRQVEGGNIFGTVWGGICTAATAVASAFEWLIDHLIPHTGGGIGLTVGIPI